MLGRNLLGRALVIRTGIASSKNLTLDPFLFRDNLKDKKAQKLCTRQKYVKIRESEILLSGVHEKKSKKPIRNVRLS